MILPAQVLDIIRPLSPWVSEKTVRNGMSYGLSAAGYDVRIKQGLILWPGRFVLASTVEHFAMPDDLLAIVHDKSTWARHGLSVFNTVIEPGWKGHLTLELKNQGHHYLDIKAGDPIAQIVFHRLEAATAMPYAGKYQDQPDRPVEAIMERA